MDDLRFALRQLRKHPGFAFVAIVTLAIGIGANTAIFSLVNALLLRPLPGIERPGALVRIGRTVGGDGFDTFGYPDFVDIRDRNRTLAAVVAYRDLPFHASGGGATERVRGAIVSWNYFDALGARPALGRFFSRDEDQPGSPAPVAVVSWAFWQRAFGGRPDAIGAALRLNDRAFTVIGVAPRAFQGIDVGSQLDVYAPIANQPVLMGRFGSMLAMREAVWLQLFGRRRAEATLAQTREDLGAIGRQLAEAFPQVHARWGIAVSDGLGFDPDSRRQVTEFLRILQGAVLLVLAIACANVANLLLVRASARRRELVVRVSLGAARTRIVRQLVTESLVLAAAGGLGGVFLAYWAGDLLRALPFAAGAAGLDLAPDARVLGFALLVSLVTGVAFGAVPAIQASRPDLASELKEGAQTEQPRATRMRSALVVSQLAVSLVLLVAAGLFVRTLRNAYAIDPGFDAGHVLVARVDLELQGYDSARARVFEAELERRLAALPGVQAASLALNLPFGGGFDTRILAQGARTDESYRTDRNSVTADYFRTMNIPIVRGRGFGAEDAVGPPRVAIVNQAIAERLWPGQDPIGRVFVQDFAESPALEVIGVAKDAKYRSLFEQRRLTYYQPLAQDGELSFVIHLRTAGDPYQLARPLERTVHELDADLPVFRIQTLGERLGISLAQQRTAATLVGTFGALALLLAAIGLYAAVAYAAQQRTREIGIRIALGARARDVVRQVLRQGVTLALAGLALGFVGALGASRLVRTQLYGVSPTDPANLGLVGLVLVAVAALASWIPARRATRVDPMVALRAE